MREIAFAVPIVPGKEPLDRQVMAELEGSRRQELEDVMREVGITRHAVWHQRTPDGTIAVVYMTVENDDAERRFVESDADVIRYFVEQMKEVHGMDISASGPEVEKIFDVGVEAGVG
jgi:hypothetical protein